MQWGLFSLQIPAGLFCGGTRMVFYSRVSAGCLLRVHARLFFFGILCNLFLGRERHLFFRGVVSLPPQPPPSLPALGARRGVLHEAEFLCRSLWGASAVARACVFFACARAGFFSLVFSVICFLGRERHLFFRGVVSLPPQAPPSLPALGARRGVLHAAEFLCRSLQGASAVARAWCFTRGAPRGVYCVCARGLFSLLFSVICFFWGRLPQFGYSLKTAGLEQMFYCTAARCDVRNLPIAKFYFAVYPQRILPMASGTLAVGKLFICRRQTKNLQSASGSLADGKIHLG